MNWFEILKDDDLLKGFESPFWLERKAELDAMGVTLIEEGEPQTEFIGRNTFQVVAEHVASGTRVVVKWMRAEKKGNGRDATGTTSWCFWKTTATLWGR